MPTAPSSVRLSGAGRASQRPDDPATVAGSMPARRLGRGRGARSRAGLAGVVLAAMVSGTACGTEGDTAGAGGNPTTAAAASGAPSGPPPRPEASSAAAPDAGAPGTPRADESSRSRAAGSIPKSVPDRVFLQAADTRADAGEDGERDDRLPSLCDAKFPSDARAGVTRTVHLTFRKAGSPPDHIPDGSLDETVTVYSGDGAQAFMSELRAAVEGCPKQTVQGRQREYRSIDSIDVGEDSLLIEERYQYADGVNEKVSWLTDRISAFRTADTVTILNATGWEGNDVRGEVIADLTRAAHRRVQGWP